MAAEEHSIATCAPFLAKLLKEGLNVGAIEAIVLHTCYESQEHSLRPLQVVLHGIDTMDSDALQPYLQVFVAILTMKDSYQKWRVNVAMHKLLDVIARNMRFKLATIACLRMLVGLAQHYEPRRWLLQQRTHWIQDWLLAAPSDGVRSVAEALIVALLSAEQAHEQQRQSAGAPAGTAGVAPAPAVPAAPAADFDASDEEAEAGSATFYARAVYDYLLSLLPNICDATKDLGLDRGHDASKSGFEEAPLRFAPYYRCLTWFAREKTMPCEPLTPLIACYDAQDGYHWECDETKKQLIHFWHAAAVGPQPESPQCSALALAAHPNNFRRLLDSFVSLRPQDRHLRYNRELLPPFYGLLRAALHSNVKQCMQCLVQHRNWEWAIKYVIVESVDYASLLAASVLPPSELVGPQETSSLSITLYMLLRPCAQHYPAFRQKILQNTLEDARLNYASPNVAALLDMLLVTAEDVQLACQYKMTLRGLSAAAETAHSRICSSPPSQLLTKLVWPHLECVLRLLQKLAEALTKMPRDKQSQQQKKRLLVHWGISEVFGDECMDGEEDEQPAGIHPLLNVILSVLEPVLSGANSEEQQLRRQQQQQQQQQHDEQQRRQPPSERSTWPTPRPWTLPTPPSPLTWRT